jgi:hypothetical protein
VPQIRRPVGSLRDAACRRPKGQTWVLAVIATPTDWVLPVAEYSIFIRPDLLQELWQVMAEGSKAVV